MDVVVKDRKTGEQRTLPETVARMMKSRFVILSEAKDTIVKPSPNLPPPQVEEVKSETADVENDAELEELRKKYEEKMGSKPHGRMKKESLKKALS